MPVIRSGYGSEFCSKQNRTQIVPIEEIFFKYNQITEAL